MTYANMSKGSSSCQRQCTHLIRHGEREHLVLQPGRVQLCAGIDRVRLEEGPIDRFRPEPSAIGGNVVACRLLRRLGRRSVGLCAPVHATRDRVGRVREEESLDGGHHVASEGDVDERGECQAEVGHDRAERERLEGKGALVRALVRVVLPVRQTQRGGLIERHEARHNGHERDGGRQPDVLVAWASVKRGDERLEDEEAGQDAGQDACAEEDDGHARHRAQFFCEPVGRLVAVLGAAALDTEGAARAPPDGEHTLLHAPPFDKGNGPQAQKGRVSGRVGRA
jgi:hypothetical protein